MACTCVQKIFQPASQTDNDRILQYSHVDSELWPKITHFEQERLTLYQCHKPRRNRLKDRRCRAHDKIHIFYKQGNPHGAEHETKKGNNAPKITAVQGRNYISSQHLYPINHLFGIQTLPFDGTLPCLIIHIACDNHQLMSTLT